MHMDTGELTGAIFIDFRKAFVTTDHKIFPDKLTTIVWNLWK